MKSTVAFLAAYAFSVAAAAFSIEGNTITLTDAEAGTCEEEGGCVIVTRKQLQEYIAGEIEKAVRAATQKSRT